MATQETTQIILGIETSCDETAAAIIAHTPTAENPYAAKILSQTVYSQFTEHECYGGVVPEIAARAHAERLPAIIQKTLTDANLTIKDVTAIAATTGPGLVGALLMGSTFGKTLALAAEKPFFPTNHIEGHALTALLTENASAQAKPDTLQQGFHPSNPTPSSYPTAGGVKPSAATQLLAARSTTPSANASIKSAKCSANTTPPSPTPTHQK